MKSNSLKYFSMMIAMNSIASQNEFYNNEYQKPTEKLEPRRKSTIKNMTEEQKCIKNGLKRFDYPNGSVYALNKKNADKKALKQNLIT